MAEIEYACEIKAIHGKLRKGDNFYCRTMVNGKNYIVAQRSQKNHIPTRKQRQAQQNLKRLRQRVSEELRERRQMWNERWQTDPEGQRYNRLCDYVAHSVWHLNA